MSHPALAPWVYIYIAFMLFSLKFFHNTKAENDLLPFKVRFPSSYVIVIVVSPSAACEVPLWGDFQPPQQQTRAAGTQVQKSAGEALTFQYTEPFL